MELPPGGYRVPGRLDRWSCSAMHSSAPPWQVGSHGPVERKSVMSKSTEADRCPESHKPSPRVEYMGMLAPILFVM